MKKKEIIDFAVNFKNLIENEHELKVNSLQSIADIGSDFEAGDLEGVGIHKIPVELFTKGLTMLITAKVLQLTSVEVRWDNSTQSPLVMNGTKIINIREDLVKAYGEGRCCYNIAGFLNSVMNGIDQFVRVESEAPLPLSEPGCEDGNYNLAVDNIIEKKLDFLSDDIRAKGLYGYGSCTILSIEEMDEIGDMYSMNLNDEFFIYNNPDWTHYGLGVKHWYVGWLLYSEEGFKLGHCNQGPLRDYNVINVSDGYSNFEIISLFDDLMENRASGNPFKVVKPLYEHMVSVKRANREKAWLFASNI